MMHKMYNFDNKGETSIYVCPDCLRAISIYSAQTNYLVIDNDQDLEDLDIGIQVELQISCDRCGCMMFKCDNTFVDRIVKLNRNGFITLFHCEGHPEFFTGIKMPDMSKEYRTILPYLTFDFNQMSEADRNLVIDAVHISGTVQTDDDLGGGLISIRPILEDRELLDHDAKVKFIEEARDQLYSFVDLLLTHIAQ